VKTDGSTSPALSSHTDRDTRLFFAATRWFKNRLRNELSNVGKRRAFSALSLISSSDRKSPRAGLALRQVSGSWMSSSTPVACRNSLIFGSAPSLASSISVERRSASYGA
jgi:hypothetical protein